MSARYKAQQNTYCGLFGNVGYVVTPSMIGYGWDHLTLTWAQGTNSCLIGTAPFSTI